MRVGVDATSWANRRGFGRFGRNVVSRLVALDPDTEYVLFAGDGERLDDVPPGARVRRVRLRDPAGERAAASSNRPPSDLLRLSVAVGRAGLDAFVFPSLYTYFPVVGVPTVVGVHDVIARELPELTVPSWRARTFWYGKESLAVRLAARVFTVSQTSQDLVAERFGLPRERLAIVPEAADARFWPRPVAACVPELEPLGLAGNRRFVLYAGGISPHKDIVTLVDAYAALRRRDPEAPPLVVAGDLEGDPYHSAAGAVRARIDASGLDGHVLTPGFVSDELLACLFSSATVVVQPSLAEGFGLPAVEAAACGAPVLLSDIRAHRETMGDAAVYFPPSDAHALQEALAGLLADDAGRTALAERGRARVATLSWDRAAEALREVIAAAVAAGR